MPTYLAKRCKIVWNDALDKTLNIGYPLDDALAYPLPREGFEAIQGSSGVEDAWVAGTDQFLEGASRWIPRDDGTTDEGNSVTGWDGTFGFASFLSWARGKKVFQFHPDIVGAIGTFYTMILVEPMSDPPEIEENGTRRVRLKMRTSDGSAVVGY